MQRRTESRTEKNFLYDFTACFLILLAHFANYLVYATYSRIFPDVFLVVLILGVVALILGILLQIPSTFFRTVIFTILISIVLADAVYEFGVADVSLRLFALSATVLIVLGVVFFLRRHLTKVIIASFIAMLFSTLVIGTLETSASRVASPLARDNEETKPIIVHLVLDEHIGLAGMAPGLPGGPALRDSLTDFYTRSGFLLFGYAYSQFFDTPSSLAGAMNFSDDGSVHKHLSARRYGYSLDKNEYFEKFARQGYRINIYQSNYFDMCGAMAVRVQKCVSYKPDTIDDAEISTLPVMERVRLVASMFYSSFALTKLAKLGEQPLREWFARLGVELPGFGLWHGRVGPIAVARTWDQMATDIANTKGGTLFFAHLLMPHYPYVYTPACDVRSPISAWSLRQLDAGGNTPESRRRHYREYFDQIRCTRKKLDNLFEIMKRNGTYDRATIVIHGDHGSRINIVEPGKSVMADMTIDDYMDGFSTFFAIKAPGILSGSDRRLLPLPRLVAYAVDGRGDRLSQPHRPTVFLPRDNAGYIEVALPKFPGALD